MSATALIERINGAESEVARAKLNRDKAYKAFASYVMQSMKRHGIKRRAIRDYMGWKEHTLGNVLNQGDRLTPAEMMKLALCLAIEGRSK